MPLGKKPREAGSSSSRTALPSSKQRRPTRATAPAPPAHRPPRRHPSSSTRPLRALAPKPCPPNTEQPGDAEPAEKGPPLIWPADSLPERPRPHLCELPPPAATSWSDQSSTTISPSLLSLTPEQRRPEAQAAEERALLAATPVRPTIPRRSGARLDRPPYQRAFSQSTRPMHAFAPRPDFHSSPLQPQYVEPSPSHRSPLERPRLYPTRADLSMSSRPAIPPRSATACPITQVLPSPPCLGHFWGPSARELVPCDNEGTIRDEFRLERVEEVEAMRRRGDDPPYWTVRHIQEVCADVHRMPRVARGGFGDLHKQLRELYDLHTYMVRLHPPAGRHPDDALTVTSGAGVMTTLPRVLRDFICGMSEHLLAKWQPFARDRPEWNVHCNITFLEDFSCFLRFNNKFYGQKVILMHAPAAPGWQDQGGLRFCQSIPFRGYKQRMGSQLTVEERSRDDFADCFWDA